MTSKECGTCTKCCEGWLKAKIIGHDMYPGKPCFFVEIGKGCTIYEDRPKDPCKDFLCEWMKIESMPDEFKPENTGVIMHRQENNGNPYLSITESPFSPSAKYLSWALVYAKNTDQNIVWSVDGVFWWIGNEDFCNQMRDENPIV